MDTQIVKLYPTDAETSSIHKWASTAMDAQEITALKGMSKADVALVALRGFELGIGMGHALDSLYVVKGRVSMSAELMRERAINAGYRIRIVSEDAEGCTISIHHKEQPDDLHEETFLLAEAQKAGLIKGGGAWTTWPKQMMRARATTNAIRWFAPQALAGCVERDEAQDIPEAFSEPRVLSAEEIAEAERRGQAAVDRHRTLDMDTVDEINEEMTRIVHDANLDQAAKKKLAKSYSDWKLDTFGVNELGQIPVSGEAEVRRWVRRLGENLGVAVAAPGAAEGGAEVAEALPVTEPDEGPEDAPEGDDDVLDGEFEDETPPEEPEDSGTGYNTEEWSSEKVPVMEFSRWLAKRYKPEAQPDLLSEAGIEKPGIAHLDAGERFQVYEYVSSLPAEQGSLPE